MSERDFPTLHAPGGTPKITSIFDISAEALGQLRLWLEMNPPAISVENVLGYQAASQATRVTRSTLSLANATLTIPDFPTEAFDFGSLHDTVTNPSRIVVSMAGKYIIGTDAEYASNATGIRILRLLRNGASVATDVRNAVNGDVTAMSLVSVIDAAVGDYVQAQLYQSSTAALNLNSAALWVARISS